MSIEEVKASYADDLRQATDEEFKQVHEELFKEQSKEYRDFMMDIFEAEKKRRNL